MVIVIKSDFVPVWNSNDSQNCLIMWEYLPSVQKEGSSKETHQEKPASAVGKAPELLQVLEFPIQKLPHLEKELEILEGEGNFAKLIPPLSVSYTHLRAHETSLHLVCRLLLEKKKQTHAHNPTSTQQSSQRQVIRCL
eukprot:TRINITY_DN65867_c0_g1_i1.p1 TRINITY_DN65867_c0_g1~~TRINITY_DN65867_c0_g1_i1.p1  ORF type:complete len:138 (-),score=11.52 TRINITY_DN65867_c0_g1_i1:37-450(-)